MLSLSVSLQNLTHKLTTLSAMAGFVAKRSVLNRTSADAVFAAINAYIDLLHVRRMPFRVLSISLRLNAINYESFFTYPAVDDFLDYLFFSKSYQC